jgi:hypothetical protein
MEHVEFIKPVDSVEPVDSVQPVVSVKPVDSVGKIVPAEDVPWDIDKFGSPAARVHGVGSQEEREQMCQMWRGLPDINIFCYQCIFIFDSKD